MNARASQVHPPTPDRPGLPAQTDDRQKRTAQPRYFTLWQAVSELRTRLARRQESQQYVIDRFRADIKPLEERLTRHLHHLTSRLIERRVDEPQPTVEQASLMGLWVIDNLETLQQHPFTGRLDIASLVHRWLDSLADLHDTPGTTANTTSDDGHDTCRRQRGLIDHYLMSVSVSRLLHTGGTGSPSNRCTDDVASWPPNHATAAASGDAAGNASDASADDTRHDAGGSERRDSKPVDKPWLDALDERLAIEPLFRRLASALHPDREPDEVRRRLCQSLMAQCIKAREENDLATLLSLFDAHVGSLAERQPMAEVRELEKLLDQQLQRLQHQWDQMNQADTYYAQIHERYYSDVPLETGQRIDRHVESLRLAIDWLHEQTQDLETPTGLLRQLSQRKEQVRDKRLIDELTGS